MRVQLTAGSASPNRRTFSAWISFCCRPFDGIHFPATCMLDPIDNLPRQIPQPRQLIHSHPSIPIVSGPAPRKHPLRRRSDSPTHPSDCILVNTACTGTDVDPSMICAKLTFFIFRIDLIQPWTTTSSPSWSNTDPASVLGWMSEATVRGSS